MIMTSYHPQRWKIFNGEWLLLGITVPALPESCLEDKIPTFNIIIISNNNNKHSLTANAILSCMHSHKKCRYEKCSDDKICLNSMNFRVRVGDEWANHYLSSKQALILSLSHWVPLYDRQYRQLWHLDSSHLTPKWEYFHTIILWY